MIAKISTGAINGIDAIEVTIEVDIGGGLPGIAIVGLPDKSIEEAKERVRSAISASGYQIPAKKITINLAPADIKKGGSGYDLPIALGILAAAEILPAGMFNKIWFTGELSLAGEIRHIHGILSIICEAKNKGVKKIYIPHTGSLEASIVKGIEIIGAPDLKSLINDLCLVEKIPEAVHSYPKTAPSYEYDFAYIKGQDHAKRALQIAAAGGHNILLSGPPGTGKTLLARSLPSILPPMTAEEQITVSKIYSVAGLLSGGIMKERPFRSPHHTSSSIALIGGGTVPHPGEVTLAHLGVLFLDELPEFQRSALEALRQPLEDGVVNIARAHSTLKFPARFTLVATQNPCPCGYYLDPAKRCICTPHQLLSYHKKASGPLLDRIDLHLEVPRISSSELSTEKVAQESASIRKKVSAARSCQAKRYKSKTKTNGSLSNADVKRYLTIDQKTKSLLSLAVDNLHLSARVYYRILKAARTIADLEESENIKKDHVAEAVQYRQVEDKGIL